MLPFLFLTCRDNVNTSLGSHLRFFWGGGCSLYCQAVAPVLGNPLAESPGILRPHWQPSLLPPAPKKQSSPSPALQGLQRPHPRPAYVQASCPGLASRQMPSALRFLIPRGSRAETQEPGAVRKTEREGPTSGARLVLKTEPLRPGEGVAAPGSHTARGHRGAPGASPPHQGHAQQGGHRGAPGASPPSPPPTASETVRPSSLTDA